MRWKKEQYDFLDTRIKEHFLFLPKRIGNEYRWLEKGKYKQCYEEWWDGICCYTRWIDKEWIDEEKRK